MNIRFKLLMALSSGVFCQLVSAQNSNMNPTSANPSNPLSTYLNNYVQPPPNAASLGKYADYPVGYFTGVPNISIPIYNLKDGGINLPISLSYHASGIHVSELASWVGLGWALNATGVINRTVRGAPDEGSHKGASIGGIAPAGYYKDHGLSTLMNIVYPVSPSNTVSDPQGLFFGSVVPGILSGGADCEPDLYTFNFNGHTGKFVFDEKGVPRLLEDNNLKIKVISNSTHSYFNSWVITTEDGIQYFFGENNATEMVRPHSNGMEDADDVAPSSWYLTRIVNPNTRETAVLNYEYEGYSYYDLGPESKLFGGSGGNQTDISYATDLEFLNGYYVDNLISTTVQGLKLTSIVTDNYTVKFIANNVRTDVDSVLYLNWRHPDGSYGNVSHKPACSLDSIKVYTNQNNACIKQFALGHGYFTSSSSGTGASVIHSLSGDVHDTQRLKLTSFAEISGDGSIQKPPYVLTYQESFQLPRRLSYDQDHWGFSNNSAGNYNNYFTPPTYTSFSTYAGGAYRHPRWPDMSAFSLTNIQDPLGVTTAFTYSPNSANNGIDPDVNPAVADTLVGGLRIKQINVTDNVTGTVQVRSFNYNTPNSNQPGGNLTHMPIYLIQLFNEYFQNVGAGSNASVDPSGFVGNASSPFMGVNGLGVQLLRQSQSIVPMQDANGNHIIYPYVKETYGLNGIGGYKVYHYSSQPTTSSALNSRLDFLNYAAYETMNYSGASPVNGYFGNGHFNDTTADASMLPSNLTYSTNFFAKGPNGYPEAPTQNDMVSGKLLEEDTFDSSGNLLTTVTNNYSVNYHENFWIRGLKAYVQNLIPSRNNQSGQPQYNVTAMYNALTFYKLHTGISHLISTTKKTYNGSSFVAEVTNFGYESSYHTLKTSDTTTSSQGDVLIDKTYYSFDYANSATADNVFGKMKARNLLEPVSTHSWKNGNLVGEKITKYYDFASSSTDTLINPANIYALETPTPLTSSQAGESIAWSGPVSSLLPNNSLTPRVNFTFDGTNGRLINQQLINDKSQGLEWSSQFKLPVTLVDNAANTPALKEFYYEGFEETTVAGLYTGNGHTGTKSVFAPYAVTWTLPNARKYVVSYWYFSNGVWNLRAEQDFNGSLTLSGGTAYDDIRIHPKDANMTNYSYDASGNLTSSMDPKGLTTYYEYDSFQRLKNIRDKDKNIVKSICYNYAGQANGCYINSPTFTNARKDTSFNKSCSSGYSGTPVTYTVSAATYISNISQQDADNQAKKDAAANGQNYANAGANGSCILNIAFTLSNTTNSGYQVNFSSGTYNRTYDFPNSGTTTVQVPIGTYTIDVYPTGTYTNHTFTLGTRSPVPNVPRTSFNAISISTTSTDSSLSIQ